LRLDIPFFPLEQFTALLSLMEPVFRFDFYCAARSTAQRFLAQ
jgi:hypothetical protein